MPRIFRPNSTIKVSRGKPKSVDMTRNKDASCTVCIPFTADIQMGTDDNVCSIDSLSLLTGSDTFNKFAQVFDEFKIQKYHCCIDLTKPQTSKLNTSVVMTPLEWNGPWAQRFIIADPNGQVDATNPNFWQQFEVWLQSAGVIEPDGNGGFQRGYNNTTVGQAYYVLEILYQLYKRQNVAVKMNGMYSLLDNNFYNFDDNAQVGIGQVSIQLNGNPQLLNISADLPNYQIIGAAALRQVPKGFYGAVSSDREHMNQELPDYFRYNDMNAQQVIEYSISNEEIESIGNYIHDSYMPGATVHLSLEVNGTSATEKSMYLPTSVVSDISQVDSFNQLGRFLPVGLLQNKVKYVDGRELLANGIFFEEHVQAVQELMRANNNNTGLILVDFMIGLVGVDGVNYTITIPFYTAPIKNDINGQLLVIPDGPYTVIGYEGRNGGSFDANDGLISWQGFEQHIYTDVSGGSIIYNTAANDDAHVESNGSFFSIQSYITVRFRNIRNVLTAFTTYYPYCIVDIDQKGLDVFDLQQNPPVRTEVFDGKNKGLIKMTTGIKTQNNQFLPYTNVIDQPLKIIRMVYLNRNTQGFLCHKFITPNDNSPFEVLDNRDVAVDLTDFVLFGVAVQVNPAYPNICFKFNCFSVNDRHNVNQWIGRQCPPSMTFHLVFVCSEIPTIDNNSVNPGFGIAPNVPANGALHSADWTQIYWGFSFSRMRSYGICDGVENNGCLEIDCSPVTLSIAANCIADYANVQTAHFSFVPLGVRVGSPWNPVSNPII